MSKTATTNLVLPEPSQELIVSEPWTMETYADDLMDQLFADLDCVLDGGGNLSSQIVQAQQITLDRASLPQLIAPPTTIDPIRDEQRRHQAQHTVANKPSKTTQRIKKPRRKIWRNLRQLLTVGAGMGLAIAAINWAISNGFLNRLTSTSMQFALQEPALQQKVLQPQSTAPTQAEIKSDLVDYMLGALTIIERQQDDLRDTATNNVAIATPVPANQTTLAYPNQPVPNVAAPRIANNAKPSPTRTTSTRVVERIYIPVYQAPQPMRYAPPVVAQAPAPAPTPLPPVTTASIEVAPKPSDNKAKKPAPVKAAKTKPPEKIAAFASIREIKPLAVKTKPVNVRQAPEIPKMKEPGKVVAPKQTATSPAPQPEQKVASVKQEKVASVPASSHVLEGLLELGEQSAALFKVNGVTRRIKLGENIGASGWTLVDVANGEAIIRRNGEVRSIFAGQKF